MKKRFWIICTVLFVMVMSGTFLISAGPVLAADQKQMQMQDQEQIYGSQLMTQEERAEYRTKMRNATTAEEREKIRNEHHELMKARAKEQGVTIPDNPPASGMGGGMGTGGGMGSGMGGGMGSGGGKR